MPLARAKFAKHSICECGHPILADHIELGRVYYIQTDVTKRMGLVCGGCKKEIMGTWVMVMDPGGRGMLPIDIFEIDEGWTA
jgi:hypothetical protein